MFANLKDQRPKTKDLRLRAEEGFTLIELSIVIVLIGLIVAGVVGGQSLVETAKINAQISDFKKYKVAYNTFKLQYNAIPGDFARASSYWTGAPDGNGNQMLPVVPRNNGDQASLTNEHMKFFEHLSRAHLIPETFRNSWDIGYGYPPLKIDSSKGMISGSYPPWGIDKAALLLKVGRPPPIGWGGNFYNGYDDFIGTGSPKTYYRIDKKIDDGIATTGIFVTEATWLRPINTCRSGQNYNNINSTEPSCYSFYDLE